MPEEIQERPKRVVVCGRDEHIARRVEEVLSNIQMERVADLPALLRAIESRSADVVLTSRESSGRESVDALRQIQKLSTPGKHKGRHFDPGQHPR